MRAAAVAAMNLFGHWSPSDFIREAGEFCTMMQESYGLDLDYSPDSLRQLEQLIGAHFGPGSADANAALIVSMGCYVGEVIIRSHGGRWAPNEEFFNQPAVVIEGKLQTHTFPIGRVWKRFEYGNDQSLVAYYGEVQRTLARL